MSEAQEEPIGARTRLLVEITRPLEADLIRELADDRRSDGGRPPERDVGLAGRPMAEVEHAELVEQLGDVDALHDVEGRIRVSEDGAQRGKRAPRLRHECPRACVG